MVMCGRFAQLLADKLSHRHQAVPLPIGQIDGVIGDLPAHQSLNPLVHAADAVIHVGEIQDLVFAKDGDRAAAVDLLDEVGDDP
jgi:hypothetical protein